jgi:hypothetical protein
LSGPEWAAVTLCPARQLTRKMTNSARPTLATYKTFEPHDNQAGKSNAKIEVSIPNPPGFRHGPIWAEYEPSISQGQYSRGTSQQEPEVSRSWRSPGAHRAGINRLRSAGSNSSRFQGRWKSHRRNSSNAESTRHPLDARAAKYYPRRKVYETFFHTTEVLPHHSNVDPTPSIHSM